MNETSYETRFICRTAIGKPLYIVAENKAINGHGGTVSSYRLSDNFADASKCMNKVTARTLIKDYLQSTNSTKTFDIYAVGVTIKLGEKINE